MQKPSRRAPPSFHRGLVDKRWGFASIGPRRDEVPRSRFHRRGDDVTRGEILGALESREVADAKSEYLASRLSDELQQDLAERDKWHGKNVPFRNSNTSSPATPPRRRRCGSTSRGKSSWRSASRKARFPRFRRLPRDLKASDRPSGIAIRIGHMQAMIAVKRATILLRFDWLTGSIGALLRRL